MMLTAAGALLEVTPTRIGYSVAFAVFMFALVFVARHGKLNADDMPPSIIRRHGALIYTAIIVVGATVVFFSRDIQDVIKLLVDIVWPILGLALFILLVAISEILSKEKGRRAMRMPY